MRISELIFQGILGIETPSRLRPDGALCRLVLPGAISAREIQDMVIACLYPMHLTGEQRTRLGFSGTTKLAALLETRHGVVRVIRKSEPGSLRLQRKTAKGYEDVAAGAAKVQEFLQTKLGLPDIKVFLPLHLWRFSPEELPEVNPAALGDDPKVPEVSKTYLQALEVESVEDQLKELDMLIREGELAMGKGAELENKLSRAQAKLEEIQVKELSPEELEMISQKDEKLDEYGEQLHRLRSEEETEIRQVREQLPESPTRQPLFWVGAALALGALVVSVVFHETHRLAALGAVPGLWICASVWIQYFINMGRASVHQVRLASIRRRINQVCQEEILLLETVDHLVLHAGVANEEELQERIPMSRKLERIVARLEEDLQGLRSNPEYRRARKELTSLQEERAVLQQRRTELPDYVMSSFQLENDLKSLGVDPVEVRAQAEAAQKEDEDEPPLDTPFQWLRAVAEWTNQWNSAGLDDSARAVWSKICGHVLSDRFNEVDLTAEGDLKVAALTEEQLELWQRTRNSEVRAVLAALALALQVNFQNQARGQALSSVWIGDPGETMTPGHAQKFENVFQSAARKSQIVICEKG